MATKNASHVYLLFWWLKSKHCKSGKFLVLDLKSVILVIVTGYVAERVSVIAFPCVIC